MRNTMGLVVAIGLAACGCGGETTTAEAARLPGSGQAVRSDVYAGRVTAYEAGRRLQIEAEDGREYSFDLDERGTQTNVLAGVNVGAQGEVRIERGGNPPKRIRVIATVR